MRRSLNVLAVALFLTLPCLLLQGAKAGYTVDANKTLETTSAMVEQKTLLPQVRVKQGLLPPLIHIPGHLWAKSRVRLPRTAAHYADRLPWYDRRALMVENGLATGAAAVLLWWTALQLRLNRRSALVVASLYAFSSIAMAYARYDYALPLAGLAVAGWMAGGMAWLRARSLRGLLGAGVSLGLLVLIRLELAVMALGGIALVLPFMREGTEHGGTPGKTNGFLGSVVRLGSPVAVGIALAMLYQIAYWGRPAGGYEGGFSATPLAGLHGSLFSLGKSLFIYNPALIPLPWALAVGWRRFKTETAFVLLSLGPAFLLYAWWGNWWGGWGWGPRHLVPLLPLLFVPLAFLLDGSFQRSRAALRAFLVFGAMGLLIQMASMSIDFNQGILIAHDQLDRTAEHMGTVPLTIEEKEQATIHLWPWSGLSIHLQAAWAFPLSDWDIGLFRWARGGSGGRGLVVMLAWLVWAASAWLAWRDTGDTEPARRIETA